MAFEFKLEDPGEGIHEAEILDILVSTGDPVEEGDDVLVAETDKAAVEIPAPVTGTVTDIKVDEGDIVEVGDVLMVFDQDGADDAATGKAEAAPADDQDENDAETTEEKTTEEKTTDAEAEAAADARGAAAEKSDAGAAKPSSGEDTVASGTETAGESTAQPSRGSDDEAAEPDRRPEDTDRQGERAQPVPATPAVRRLARELGVDLDAVDASGDDGRVRADDVRAAASKSETGKPERSRDAKDGGLPDFDRWGDTERVELRSIRRSIARRMARSWREIPHVTHQDEIDITDLERLRRAHADEIAERGGQLTLTPFFVKALSPPSRSIRASTPASTPTAPRSCSRISTISASRSTRIAACSSR